MPEHTYEELKHKTIAELRELAAGIEHEAVQGYTQLNKEHLLPGLCTALGIEMHEHHEVVGIDKGKVKAEIRQFKQQRDAALSRGDKAGYHAALRGIHRGKRTLRRSTV